MPINEHRGADFTHPPKNNPRVSWGALYAFAARQFVGVISFSPCGLQIINHLPFKGFEHLKGYVAECHNAIIPVMPACS